MSGLGSHLQGQNNKWHMEPTDAVVSHKLPGTPGCVAGAETFSALFERAACSGQDGQYHGSGIYQQTGGRRSRNLHMLAHRLIMWSSAHLLSLRATHIPGVLNLGADLLSRGNPRYKDWKLYSEVVAQIWKRYGRAKVDLFTSEESAQCPLFYSLTGQSAPMGLDALVHEWPCVLRYAFPPLELITPTLARVWERGLTLILMAGETLASGDISTAARTAVASAPPQGYPNAGAWRDLSSSSGAWLYGPGP